jgi:hypothetical protein
VFSAALTRLRLRRRLYYGAMAVNAALRLTWVFSLVTWAHPGAGTSAHRNLSLLNTESNAFPLTNQSGLVMPTVLAFVEVARRCLWNYFRVENEHVANAGAFRATAAVPLPAGAKAPAGAASTVLAAARARAVSARFSSMDDPPSAAGAKQEEAAGLLAGDALAAAAAEVGAADAAAAAAGGADLVVPAKVASEWDRTASALRRVGTFAASLHDDEPHADVAAAVAAAAAEAAPAGEADAESGAASPRASLSSPRAPASPLASARSRREFGEHFNWVAEEEHSDED